MALGPAAPEGGSLRQLSTHELGVLGEELAARYLRGQGFTLIGRNVNAPEAELDIVAIDGQSLVVVEVKAGWCPQEPGGPRDGSRWDVHRPGARITKSGVVRRQRAARRMASGNGLQEARVDAVEVIAGRTALASIVHHRGVLPGVPLGSGQIYGGPPRP